MLIFDDDKNRYLYWTGFASRILIYLQTGRAGGVSVFFYIMFKCSFINLGFAHTFETFFSHREGLLSVVIFL